MLHSSVFASNFTSYLQFPAGCRFATVVSRISLARSARHYSATFPSCISLPTSRIVTALADVAPVRES